MPIRRLARQDPTVFVDTDMKLLPLFALFLAMLLGVLFPLSTDLESCAVNDEGHRSSRDVGQLHVDAH